LVVEEKILHVEKQILQHHSYIQEEAKEKPSTSDKLDFKKQHVNDKDATLFYVGIVVAIVVAILMGIW